MSNYIPVDKENQILDHPCACCDEPIKGRRKDAKYCSAQCNQTAEKQRYKAKKGVFVTPRGPNTGRSKDPLAYRLGYKYGITVEQYDSLREKQNYCCAVCGKHENDENRRLAVDHNHKTMEIRGLLCTYCNHRIVGKWTDGNLLRKIASYIEQGTGWFVPVKNKRKRKGKNA